MASTLARIGRALNRAPVPYIGRGITAPQILRNNATQQMAAMGSLGTLFAIVDRLATATAQGVWRLYRASASGRDEDRKTVTRHAALDLWRKPNPFYTLTEFVETIQQHFDLTGEYWIVIYRDPRSPLPLELWPVRPDRMEPVPGREKFIAGYFYRSPDGQKIPLELDEVIFAKRPNPLDPYRGMGPVQSVLVDIDAARYSAEWNRNFFINGAEPGGIIKPHKPLDDNEFRQLVARWREQHQGVANAHRVAVLEGADWEQAQFTMRDMQFAQLRAVPREIVREAFGFPVPLLGQTIDVNRANFEAADLMFTRWLVTPRLRRLRGTLNDDLLPLYGNADSARPVEFDFDPPESEDREIRNAEVTAKASAAKTYVEAGYHRGDALLTVGAPPMRYEEDYTSGTAPAPAPPPAVEPGEGEEAEPVESNGNGGGRPPGALRKMSIGVN